ncbi:MAG: 30S ribosomal protein S20 [Candidatus Roizmanbacteria bacterium GW2011_GWA2_36_23]|uniref:Small ribosomal subunit protein bS20 n=1 Tax=Candidatus Roizmanbacteria bacterium GW2011_GWA2_36_23 TaxID=1618480 RepID=A0A0G0HE49_9BACT|nr:MAG: 30S ribosomal protein S20 [Candidatus Roizmanbacteria bacterium GW2011_GWA2_36_23]
MPIIKSAKKKVRKDKKRTVQNALYTKAYKDTLKKIRKGGDNLQELLKKFYSQIDKSVKKQVIHKNKGNRLKAQVSKFVKSFKGQPKPTKRSRKSK